MIQLVAIVPSPPFPERRYGQRSKSSSSVKSRGKLISEPEKLK